MKFIKIISFLLCFSFLFVGCKKQKNKFINSTYADLTHNTVAERLVVNREGIDKSEAYVKVYTKIGDDYKLIWKDIYGTVDDQKALYLSSINNRFYLFAWKPTYSADTTTLEFAIFHFKLNEDETLYLVNEVDADTITFTEADTKKGSARYEEVSDFVFELNHYLEKSTAILDTIDGDVIYSKNMEEKTFKNYYPEWYDKDYFSDNFAQELLDAQDGWNID